jgi:sugar transferase (PEP-CTERM system associated)
MISRNGSRAFCILICESLLNCLCGVVAIWIRFGSEAHEILTNGHGWLKVALSVVVVQGSFYIFDLYDFQLIRHRVTLYIRISQAMGLASIALAAIFYVFPRMLLGRGVFLLGLVLMMAVMVLWRVCVTWLLGHPRLAERILILGTEKGAIDLAREVLERCESGYKIVGFVGDDPNLVGQSLINPSVIGVTADLERLVREYGPDRIVVAVKDRRGHLPVDPLLRLKLRGLVAVEESASFFERLTGKISTETVRPSWLIFSNGSRGLRIYKRARRLVDAVFSILGLILSAPLMAITMLAIKLDSQGPVFYRQERVGEHNNVFRIIKFRSMVANAEKDGPVWANEDDPRVTRVGRLIRRLRIDELPQFVNVLRGEMSFIGPRPERPVFVSHLEREIPYYSQRHLIKPGVTGWAQIRYPYGASVEDAMQKLQYDLYYIKNQSPVLDAIILFETIRIVLFGRGAR